MRLFHLVFESHDGRALGADSEEKHEPVSDIDTAVVDGLKVLDPERPIREADIALGNANAERRVSRTAASNSQPMPPEPGKNNRALWSAMRDGNRNAD
jgi:hypothetical protein